MAQEQKDQPESSSYLMHVPKLINQQSLFLQVLLPDLLIASIHLKPTRAVIPPCPRMAL